MTMRYLALGLVLVAVVAESIPPAHAQSVLRRSRGSAAQILEQIAPGDQGILTGSCLRPIGGRGSEEFALYLLLPSSRSEGFIVELSGSGGSSSDVVSNAAIVVIEDGEATVRDNGGGEWTADAYRMAAEWIRLQPMNDDPSYEAALARLPTEQCPVPDWAS